MAITTSLLLGNILLPTDPVLAQKTGDPFDRDGDPANIGREFRPPRSYRKLFLENDRWC